MAPILGIIASQQPGHVVTGSYESIQTITVGSGGASSITFSSIPQTYKHLQVRIFARFTNPVSGGMQSQGRFNGNSGSNYTYNDMWGTGSAATTDGGATYTWFYGIDRFPAGNDTASSFGASVFDVLDYSSTNKNKSYKALGGYDANGSGRVWMNSGLWTNTSAVTDIYFEPQGGGGVYAQYSQFALYGIKG